MEKIKIFLCPEFSLVNSKTQKFGKQSCNAFQLKESTIIPFLNPERNIVIKALRT